MKFKQNHNYLNTNIIILYYKCLFKKLIFKKFSIFIQEKFFLIFYKKLLIKLNNISEKSYFLTPNI